MNRRSNSILLLLLAWPCSALAAQDVELGWDPSPDASVVGYSVYYGPGTGNYTNKVTVGNTTSAIVTGLREMSRYYFAATAFTADNLESDFSVELAYTPGWTTPDIEILQGTIQRATLSWSGPAGWQTNSITFNVREQQLGQLPNREDLWPVVTNVTATTVTILADPARFRAVMWTNSITGVEFTNGIAPVSQVFEEL